MSKKLFYKTAALLVALAAALPVCAADFPEEKASVYVYDEADVISQETEADINSRADALFAMSGAQIITVCVDSTGSTPIGEYATSLFNEWQIGSPQRDNGILCVMAVEDREYWLLQGNGIKNEITNGQLQVINNDYLEGYFAEENYDAGAKAVFDQLLLKFQDLYSIDITKWDGKYIDFTYPEGSESETTAPAETPAYDMMGFLTVFLWIAVAVVLVIVVIVVVSFMRRPKFVSGGYFHRRKYKSERGPYVNISPISPNPPRRPNGARPGAQRPQRPQGQRPAGMQNQRSASQTPGGQVHGTQTPRGQIPGGQRPRAQRPMGQRPSNGTDPRSPRRRTPPQTGDTPKTVYPDNPPYLNGSRTNPQNSNNYRNGGSK